MTIPKFIIFSKDACQIPSNLAMTAEDEPNVPLPPPALVRWSSGDPSSVDSKTKATCITALPRPRRPSEKSTEDAPLALPRRLRRTESNATAPPRLLLRWDSEEELKRDRWAGI